MSPEIRVLIVDDNPDQRSLLMLMAAELGYVAESAADGQEAIEKLSWFPADILLTDLSMPRLDGVGLLQRLRQEGRTLTTIVITAYGNIQKAVTMVHELEAFWFLEKPFDLETLELLLRRATERSTLSQDQLQKRLADGAMLGGMVGQSASMQGIFAQMQQLAPTSASVLITGESGTGKEMVAQAIHRLSPRRDGPFVAINCAALRETLIESELFGHEKGSFTGAAERRAGCFEVAQGGTLLLDEIGEMQPATQAKLLRVVEGGVVRRLGGKSEIQADVRVLAATNKVLEVAISKGELRQDLYYRLSVFQIHLPPLRERKEDLPLIACALLADLNQKHGSAVSELDPAALARIQQYDWPGNVRELRNVLERAVILAREGPIRPAHLPADLPGASEADAPSENREVVKIRVGSKIAEAERDLILKTLEFTEYNKKRAAEILGITLKTLQNKLKEYDVWSAAA